MQVISDKHYEKFVQSAQRNPKIIRIPTDGELEDNGFGISDLYYLVLPDGLQVNPETVDPKIFDELYQPMFLSEYKTCCTCGKERPLEDFKKQQGRGGRKSECMECEENKRASIASSIVNSLSRDTVQVVDGRSGLTKRYVNYQDVAMLVNEAYERGKAEGQVNIETVRPTVDELLEIGA